MRPINKKIQPQCLVIRNKIIVFSTKRHFFSLLEMLVVMVIIALVASLAAIKIVDLLKQQRFRTGAEIILEKLNIAQNIMLVFSSDVTVTLYKNSHNENLICKIKVDTGITPTLAKIIGHEQVIKGVKSAKFEGEGTHSHGLPVSLRFNFLSFEMPKGRLFLSSNETIDEGSLQTKTLYLTGYPRPLSFDYRPGNDPQSLGLSESLYPKEIREEWLLQMQEDTTNNNTPWKNGHHKK